MNEERKPIIITLLIGAAMLLLAMPSIWPYGYYILLRWAICGISVFVAYNAYKWNYKGRVWILGFIALLFNPLIPVHLDKETWAFVDLLVAGVYLVGIFKIKE
jgi:hypothetical protein